MKSLKEGGEIMRHDWSWKAATKCFAVGLLVFGVTVGLAPLVGAVPITALDGTWQNAVGGDNVSINNGTDPRTIRWGNVSPPTSGYNWSPTPTPFDAPSDGTPFSLGTFDHLNFVIPLGTAITGVDLDFSMTIDALTPTQGLIHFNHNETPNDDVPGGVPDVVTISSPFMNTPFNYLGTDYIFSLLGFSQDGGNTIVTQFSTQEGQENIADLYGAISVAPPIPEPATMLLLGSGLIGLAGFARRRFKK
jgi:hypothetical protein